MKKLEIGTVGRETIRHVRRLCIEVPDDTTGEEVEVIMSAVFDDIPEPPQWEYDESFGVFGYTDIPAEIVRAVNDSRSADCRFVRDDFGDLVLATE